VCWDNAAAESFFATLKNRQRFDARAKARFAVAGWVLARLRPQVPGWVLRSARRGLGALAPGGAGSGQGRRAQDRAPLGEVTGTSGRGRGARRGGMVSAASVSRTVSAAPTPIRQNAAATRKATR
jgi:hypothetical protein